MTILEKLKIFQASTPKHILHHKFPNKIKFNRNLNTIFPPLQFSILKAMNQFNKNKENHPTRGIKS